MSLRVAVEMMLAIAKFSMAQIIKDKPNGSQCMQVDIAYRRKLQALVAVGL